jgi:oxalate decarboxylase/phosphoglucose isomerase-like protein (cupin superfamily)
MTVFASAGNVRSFNCQAGDVGLCAIPNGAHYRGNEPLRYLEIFRNPRFVGVSLNQWMALTPPKLAQAEPRRPNNARLAQGQAHHGIVAVPAMEAQRI